MTHRHLLRVRYGECDAQSIVFNARWADYVDIAVTEYTRALFGSTDPAVAGLDWRLRRQTLEWRAPARFDEVVLMPGIETRCYIVEHHKAWRAAVE